MALQPVPNRFNLPDLGLGVGLRTVHFNHILTERPDVDWFEIISENFMNTGGKPGYILDQIAERYPIVAHGVSLSIGSTDPLNFEYLKKLKALLKRVNAVWAGDHLCWTGVLSKNSHDLLPMPYNEETLKYTVGRIKTIQEYLERPLVVENPSTYITFKASTMPEEVFVRRMAEDSDCALLLDVNNVYVSARNHDLDPIAYLKQIPYDRVVQIHLAGHTDKGTHCIDTHDGPVINPVWKLYAEAMKRAGSRATLIEWDDKIPKFEEVHAEVLRARRFRVENGVLA